MLSIQFIPSDEKFRLRIPSLLIAVCLAAFFITSCGDDTSTGPDINDNGDPSDEAVIQMVGQSFSPSNLEVEAGTTVTWQNSSDLVHTVTSGSDREHDELFNSGDVAPGDSYSFTFTDTGTFDYFCIPHPGMAGTITVVEGD